MADKIKVIIEVDPDVETTIKPFTPRSLADELATEIEPGDASSLSLTKTATATATNAPGGGVDADVDVDVDF